MFYDSMIAVDRSRPDPRLPGHRSHARRLNGFCDPRHPSNIPFQAALMQHPVFHWASLTPASFPSIT